MNIREGWRKHMPAHVGWIISVLSILVIVLVSNKVGNDENIKDIINTSLALSSLVLASIAILQALLSNNDLREAVTEVRSLASSISEPASKIIDAANNLSDRSEYIAISAAGLNDRIDQITASKQVGPAAAAMTSLC